MRLFFLFKDSHVPLCPGFIMTVSRPCYFGNLLLGVVGVDVNLAYILEDVTYYQDSLASYTFLIDNKGQLKVWTSVSLSVYLRTTVIQNTT